MKSMRKNTFYEIKWKQKKVSKSNIIGFLLSIWGTNESKNHPSRMSRILVTQVSREILKNNPKNLLNINNYPNEIAYDFSSPISTDWCNKIHSHNFLWFLKYKTIDTIGVVRPPMLFTVKLAIRSILCFWWTILFKFVSMKHIVSDVSAFRGFLHRPVPVQARIWILFDAWFDAKNNLILEIDEWTLSLVSATWWRQNSVMEYIVM